MNCSSTYSRHSLRSINYGSKCMLSADSIQKPFCSGPRRSHWCVRHSEIKASNTCRTHVTFMMSFKRTHVGKVVPLQSLHLRISIEVTQRCLHAAPTRAAFYISLLYLKCSFLIFFFSCGRPACLVLVPGVTKQPFLF